MVHVVLPKAGDKTSWMNGLPGPVRLQLIRAVFHQSNDHDRPVNIRVAGEKWNRLCYEDCSGSNRNHNRASAYTDRMH